MSAKPLPRPAASPAPARRRRRGDYYPDTISRKARELQRTRSSWAFASIYEPLWFAAPIHLAYAAMLAGEIIAGGCTASGRPA